MQQLFFRELEQARSVLIAGAGGGFDVFAGLPLYFWLQTQGCEVHLANLTFSDLSVCDGMRPTPALYRIGTTTQGHRTYFPEQHLSRFLSERWGETPVWAVDRVGVQPIAQAYQWLANELGFDTLILIDGGTDSLMRGDEAGLGTPEEDSASLCAARLVEGPERKYLVAIGFGVDSYHGVSHANFLENVSALIQVDAYLGCWSLTREMPEFQLYKEACQYVIRETPRGSIVNSSIIDAVDGWFGDWHSSERTRGSKLFINPLMALHWAFRLDTVADANLYLEKIEPTVSYGDLAHEIVVFHHGLQHYRHRKSLPM